MYIHLFGKLFILNGVKAVEIYYCFFFYCKTNIVHIIQTDYAKLDLVRLEIFNFVSCSSETCKLNTTNFEATKITSKTYKATSKLNYFETVRSDRSFLKRAYFVCI